MTVRALRSDDVGGAGELELTEYARTFVPALPFGAIDVLIIEQGGKDISGTTLDPNVTGRFWVDGLADFGMAKAAWFKDSEGNTYELTEVRRTP